jgi:hypothetical protein
MARGELHIPLYVEYADDEKLEGVSRLARLLYIDACCKSKKLLSDGFISDVQVEKLCHPDSPAKARRQAGELVASGAWIRDEGRKGYVIPAYLKRNPSRAEILRKKDEAAEAGVRGNHERWHKDRIEPSCPLCPSSDPPPDDIGSGSGDPMEVDRPPDRVLSPESESESESESVSKRSPTPAHARARSAEAHNGEHPNCRACGTNQRRRGTNPRALHAVAEMPPLYCSTCHETYPVRKGADGRYLGCPRCHPEASTA